MRLFFAIFTQKKDNASTKNAIRRDDFPGYGPYFSS